MLIYRRIVNSSNWKVHLSFKCFSYTRNVLCADNLTPVWRRVNVPDNEILPNCHYHSLKKIITVEIAQ